MKKRILIGISTGALGMGALGLSQPALAQSLAPAGSVQSGPAVLRTPQQMQQAEQNQPRSTGGPVPFRTTMDPQAYQAAKAKAAAQSGTRSATAKPAVATPSRQQPGKH